MKVHHFLLTALFSLLIGMAMGFVVTNLSWQYREQRDFRATATALNKQIKTELPKMCAALGASGVK